jgi:tRNA C32,U32 (ribose-2'-O)-methylase TrmJ
VRVVESAFLPVPAEFDRLRVVLVCLYELVRDARVAPQPEKQELATAGEVERITVMLLDVLRASGYVNPRRKASTEENVRRLVRRLNLPARDIEFWLGILRQITWKVRSGKNQQADAPSTHLNVSILRSTP